MFHVKQRRRLGLLLLVFALGVLAVGCSGAAGARGWAAPVRAGDVLIVSTGGGRLDGLDRSGRQVWRFPEIWEVPDGISDDLDAIYGVPVLSADGRVVFVGDYNGYVYAFRPGDFIEGVTVRQPFAAAVKLDGPVIGGLALNTPAGLLYATSENRIFSISAMELTDRIETRGADPARAILFEAEDEIWSTPVLADGKLLFSSLDGYLYAIDPVNGNLAWRFNAGKGLVSTPVIVGDRVLVAGFGSTLHAVEIDDGTEAWSFRTNHWIWGKPAVDQNTAYFGDFDGIVHAVGTSNGAESWSLALDRGPIRSSPAIASGTLIVSTDDGWLVGVDIRSQEIAWQRHVGSPLNADMTVDGSNVYISPKGCVAPEGGGDRVYYMQVNPANGDLTTASGVC
jgi:outer membrane protein assembly factor BamB